MKKDDRERCSWATTELYKEYHDEEWGKPVHDDRKLFEMLVLEGMQAGLSWLTILNKRAAFKEALISLFGLMLRIDRFIIISNRKRTFLQQRHFQIESVKT